MVASLKEEAYELGLAEGTWRDWRARKELNHDVLRWVTERDWVAIDQRYERGLMDKYQRDMFAMLRRAAQTPVTSSMTWQRYRNEIRYKHEDNRLWEKAYAEVETELEALWFHLTTSDI